MGSPLAGCAFEVDAHSGNIHRGQSHYQDTKRSVLGAVGYHRHSHCLSFLARPPSRSARLLPEVRLRSDRQRERGVPRVRGEVRCPAAQTSAGSSVRAFDSRIAWGVRSSFIRTAVSCHGLASGNRVLQYGGASWSGESFDRRPLVRTILLCSARKPQAFEGCPSKEANAETAN